MNTGSSQWLIRSIAFFSWKAILELLLLSPVRVPQLWVLRCYGVSCSSIVHHWSEPLHEVLQALISKACTAGLVLSATHKSPKGALIAAEAAIAR